MIDIWAENGPPLYISLAAFCGFKPKKRRGEDVLDIGEELAAFLSAHPDGSQKR